MASVILGSGRVLSSKYISPKKDTCLTPMEHLSALNTRPYSVARFVIACVGRSCPNTRKGGV